MNIVNQIGFFDVINTNNGITAALNIYGNKKMTWPTAHKNEVSC